MPIDNRGSGENNHIYPDDQTRKIDTDLHISDHTPAQPAIQDTPPQDASDTEKKEEDEAQTEEILAESDSETSLISAIETSNQRNVTPEIKSSDESASKVVANASKDSDETDDTHTVILAVASKDDTPIEVIADDTNLGQTDHEQEENLLAVTTEDDAPVEVVAEIIPTEQIDHEQKENLLAVTTEEDTPVEVVAEVINTEETSVEQEESLLALTTKDDTRVKVVAEIIPTEQIDHEQGESLLTVATKDDTRVEVVAEVINTEETNVEQEENVTEVILDINEDEDDATKPAIPSIVVAQANELASTTDKINLSAPIDDEQLDEIDPLEDTAKRPVVVVPAKNTSLTPNQETTIRYNEQRRSIRERLSAALPIVKANGTHTAASSPESLQNTALIESQKTVRLPQPETELQPKITAKLSQGQSYVADTLYVPRSRNLSPTEEIRTQRRKKLVIRHISRKHMRRDRDKEHRTAVHLWTGIIGTLVTCIVLFLAVFGGGSYISYAFYTQTQAQYLPEIINLRGLMPHDNLKMFDSQNVSIYQMVDQGIHTTVTLDHISKHLVNATVATEDKNFWTNPGVDITRIIQAALDDVRHGHVVEGGSTITQQLIKNIVVNNKDQTVIRKLQEIVLTPAVNSRYSKNDIMEMYLNSINYGAQVEGADAAASIYFGLEDQLGTADKPGKTAAEQLDIAQSAMLAGIPSSPSAYNPRLHPVASFTRFQTILDLMLKNGYITKVEQTDAINEAKSPDFLKYPTSLQNRAPHFAEFVLRELEKQYNLKRDGLSRSDMRITTTLDITLQDKIQKIAQQHVAELNNDYNHVSNAAEVLIDFHTGAVRSLLGSIDYNDTANAGQFDVATLGYRQPGSSFKPYVYVTAFGQGISPGQAIDDNKLSIPLPAGSNPPTYTPPNYDGKYHGHMTLRCALQNSLNIPAVKVLQHVGVEAAMKTAQDMGLGTDYQGTPGLSLVLGGLDVHLIDHTSAFGTFANGGVHVPYYGVQKIEFPTLHKTYEHPTVAGKQAISPQMAYIMSNVLSDNTSRIAEFFDCNPLQLYSNSTSDCYAGNRGQVRPAAAKTGTTDNFVDNLTMGYTTDYVMGVWAGNNDHTPMRHVTGIQGAAPIWHDSMLAAEDGHPVQDFPNPGGLVQKSVTYADGVSSTDLYLEGKTPNSGSAPTNSGGDAKAPKAGGGAFCSTFSLAFPAPADDYPDGRSPNAGWW